MTIADDTKNGLAGDVDLSFGPGFASIGPNFAGTGLNLTDGINTPRISSFFGSRKA